MTGFRRTGLALLALLCLSCTDDQQRVVEFIDRGQDYVEAGEDPEAIIEFKNVLQLDPENAAAHEALSMAYLRQQRPREAYWEMSETVRVDPENVEARLRYGTISAAIGDFDLSLEQAEAVLERDSNNARGYALRGQARENAQDLEGAESDFRAAAKAQADAAAFQFLVASFLERQGRLEEAEAAYRELVELEESYLAVSSLMRIIARDATREQEVEAQIDRLLVVAAQAPREALEVPAGAEDTGTTTLSYNVLRDKALRDAYALKASLLNSRGDSEGAVAILEEGVAKSDTKVDLIYHLATLYRRLGRVEDEQAMIRRATQVAPESVEAQLVLSAYLGDRGDLEGALEAAHAAVLAGGEEDIPSRLREAELLTDLGFRDGAEEYAERGLAIVEGVLEKNPDSPEAHFVKAKIELAEGDAEAAKESIEATLQGRPDWAQAHYVLGSTLASLGDLTRARTELEAAVEREPRLDDARKLLAQIYSRLGEHEFAIEQGRAYLANRPDDSELRITVGQSLIRVGRTEEAFEVISVIPEDQRDAASHFALGRIDLAYGRVKEGTARLRRADEMAPGNAQVLRTLLAIDRSEGRLKESADRIARAVQTSPDDSEIVELDAEAKLLQGDAEGARASLVRAVELEPRNVTAQLALAELVSRDGDRAGALAVIESAASAAPESVDLQYRLAQAYEQGGRVTDAVSAYERAIGLNPNLSIAKNNLAYLLAESGGDLDRALELAREAKEQLPDDANAADTLGFVLLKRGLASAAIGYFEEAAERFPDGALEIRGIVGNHLAQAYEQNEEREKALTASRAALDLYDQLADALTAQGGTPSEPGWAQESRARIERLDTAS